MTVSNVVLCRRGDPVVTVIDLDVLKRYKHLRLRTPVHFHEQLFHLVDDLGSVCFWIICRRK